MHQKHPPAKIAVLVVGGRFGGAARIVPESVATTAIDANKNLLIGGNFS